MDRRLLTYFWNCGDNEIIEFAIHRAHLNRLEKEVVTCMMDECLTQEETAEKMGYSPRRIQDYWYSASAKLLHIPWVVAYCMALKP